MKRTLRVFTDGTDWQEATAGGRPAVRISAGDLRQARQLANRARAESPSGNGGIAVVLDVRVVVAETFRAAARKLAATTRRDTPESVGYVGTVDGLAGLVRDVYAAGVADGVTLIPDTEGQDVQALALAVIARAKTEPVTAAG
ncbi:MAG TPA: hypothetical protein VFW21_08400 [Mycobacterium sp.]|nr:hypothetical protein [Mycobacterium sp.]